MKKGVSSGSYVHRNNPKKRMNTSSVDATQSCEALLQNLNEDYQVFLNILGWWMRSFQCWRQLCREDGQLHLWTVLIPILMKSNSIQHFVEVINSAVQDICNKNYMQFCDSMDKVITMRRDVKDLSVFLLKWECKHRNKFQNSMKRFPILD